MTRLYFRADVIGDGPASPGIHFGLANLTRLNGNSGGSIYSMLLSTSTGSGLVNRTANTVAGTTPGIEIGSTSSTSNIYDWISLPFSTAVTISGTITVNIWASENSMSANVAINVIIERLNNVGLVASTIAQTTRTTELGTTNAVNNFTVTPTSTNMLKGDRLRVRIYGDDAGTMASGFTFQAGIGGTTGGADGDSWLDFTESLAFQTSEPAGTTLYLKDTAGPDVAGSVEKEMSTSQGTGVTTAVRNTAAGPTSPLQWTDSAGGTSIEWYSLPLEAFTLANVVKCNIWCQESNGLANAALYVELAVCDNDGTNAVVWAANCIRDCGSLGGTAGSSPQGVSGEFPTTATAFRSYLAGDDLDVTDGQRLRLRCFVDDAADASMASSHTATLHYNADTGGATGDTYIVLGQTITEIASVAADSTVLVGLGHPAEGIAFQNWFGIDPPFIPPFIFKRPTKGTQLPALYRSRVKYLPPNQAPPAPPGIVIHPSRRAQLLEALVISRIVVRTPDQEPLPARPPKTQRRLVRPTRPRSFVVARPQVNPPIITRQQRRRKTILLSARLRHKSVVVVPPQVVTTPPSYPPRFAGRARLMTGLFRRRTSIAPIEQNAPIYKVSQTSPVLVRVRSRIQQPTRPQVNPPIVLRQPRLIPRAVYLWRRRSPRPLPVQDTPPVQRRPRQIVAYLRSHIEVVPPNQAALANPPYAQSRQRLPRYVIPQAHGRVFKPIPPQFNPPYRQSRQRLPRVIIPHPHSKIEFVQPNQAAATPPPRVQSRQRLPRYILPHPHSKIEFVQPNQPAVAPPTYPPRPIRTQRRILGRPSSTTTTPTPVQSLPARLPRTQRGVLGRLRRSTVTPVTLQQLMPIDLPRRTTSISARGRRITITPVQPQALALRKIGTRRQIIVARRRAVSKPVPPQVITVQPPVPKRFGRLRTIAARVLGRRRMPVPPQAPADFFLTGQPCRILRADAYREIDPINREIGSATVLRRIAPVNREMNRADGPRRVRRKHA